MISYTNILITACCIVLLSIATRKKKGITKKEEKEIQRLNIEIKRRKLEKLLKDME